MSRPASLARNVLSNWVVLASNVAYGFFITPIIVKGLNAELYGVWSFLNGLLAYSELLYLGLGSALIKYVAQFRARQDQTGINRLTSVVASIYGVLGLVCLGTFAALGTVVPQFFAEPLSPAAAEGATVTCALLGARLLALFVGSAFAGVIVGHDRYDVVNGVHLLSVGVRFAATPFVVADAANPLVGLAWLTAAVGGLETISLAAVAFLRVPGLRVRPSVPRWSELQWLYGFGVQSFFIVLAVKLISYTDTTVIGITLGAASVTLYSLPLQLVEYARLNVGGFAGVLLPRMAVLTAQAATEELRRAYLRAVRIGCFLAGWIGALLIALGPAFLSRWIGPEFDSPVFFWVLAYLVIAMFGQVLSSQVPLAFYQSLHYLRVPAAVLMAEALANLGLSLWLAPRLGITGVALATAVPALASVVILPPYLCRKLGVPIRDLLAEGVWPGLLTLGIILALLLGLGWNSAPASFASMAFRAALSVPVAFALLTVTFPADDRRAVWRLLPWVRPHEAGRET